MKDRFIKVWRQPLLLYKKIIYLVQIIIKAVKSIIRQAYTHKKIFYIIPITLLISVSQNLSSRSQLEFSFSSMIGTLITENTEQYYQFNHNGLIKNKSKEKNTITKISLVVWADDTQESTLRDGYAPNWIIDNRTGEKVRLPFIIEGREAVDITIFNKLLLQGTEDKRLLSERKQIEPGSPVTLPKYEYQLVFTDINDNEFDQHGKLVNRDVINMNWTLENYCGEIHYKVFPCLKEKMKILDSKVMFEIKNMFHWFGMETIGDEIYKLFFPFKENT